MISSLRHLTILVSAYFLVTAPAMAARPDGVLAELPKATWIAEGQGSRIVYIFFDPNCPACQNLYTNLRAFVANRDLQVRWIPVAIVNVTSAGRAAAILQAPEPLAAFRKNEEHYREESYSGGLGEDIPTAETERRLQFNEHLLNRFEIPVVPSMIFADKSGRAILIQGSLSPLALRKVFSRLP